MHHYQNSLCVNGYLHDFVIIEDDSQGTREVCRRCKKDVFWKPNTPNHIYLSFHIRQALQPSDTLFSREYPDFGK